jgi:hypothetical protein
MSICQLFASKFCFLFLFSFFKRVFLTGRFCVTCIDEWTKKSPICPVCREDVPSSRSQPPPDATGGGGAMVVGDPEVNASSCLSPLSLPKPKTQNPKPENLSVFLLCYCLSLALSLSLSTFLCVHAYTYREHIL